MKTVCYARSLTGCVFFSLSTHPTVYYARSLIDLILFLYFSSLLFYISNGLLCSLVDRFDSDPFDGPGEDRVTLMVQMVEQFANEVVQIMYLRPTIRTTRSTTHRRNDWYDVSWKAIMERSLRME